MKFLNFSIILMDGSNKRITTEYKADDNEIFKEIHKIVSRKIVSQDLGAQVPYTQSGIYQPAPAAYQPAPAAYQPTPAAYQPTPAAYQPAPTAYQPAPGSIPVNKSQNYGVITQKLVCSDCGFENSPGNRFCGECGKKLQ